MTLTKSLLEGAKLIALFGAVALVVWTMPDDESVQISTSHSDAQISASHY